MWMPKDELHAENVTAWSTEHVIDDLSNALFSISEPRWSSPEDSQRIKKLKRRVHDLYADYRQASQKSGSAG